MTRKNAPKPPNHALSEMKCPVSLEDVDLFGPGAQEHWYEAYEILHSEAPVQKLADEGIGQGSDGYRWLFDRIASLAYAPGNQFLHQPGIMLGTLELQLAFERSGVR
jgi:hypothetical protein